MERTKDLRFATHTKVGKIPGQPGKVNQDSVITCKDFAGYPNLHLFGALDGHGYFGREASNFVKNKFPEALSMQDQLLEDNKRALIKAFEETSAAIENGGFDARVSGTTLVSVLITPKKLWCANVGNSRAIMGRLLRDGPLDLQKGRHWMSIALSRDHKLNERDEEDRIVQSGGLIARKSDEVGRPVGVPKIWHRSGQVPPMTVSRSLGDIDLSSQGVIGTPEILEYNITQCDRFFVLGSDGLFEFLSNEEVVKLVVPFWKKGDMKGAAEKLYNEAEQRWRNNEEVIDDITVIVIFLP